jgi:hypothetical protein
MDSENFKQGMQYWTNVLDKYIVKDGGSVPEFFRLTVHFRCLQIINRAIKEAKVRTEIRTRDVIFPFKWYSSCMIDEIYTELEVYYLKRNIEIDFSAFNPGSVVSFKYLVRKSAPSEFKQIVKERISEEITMFNRWNEDDEVFRIYKKEPVKIYTRQLRLDEIMGPYFYYDEKEYSQIFSEVMVDNVGPSISLVDKITYTFKKSKLDCNSPTLTLVIILTFVFR